MYEGNLYLSRRDSSCYSQKSTGWQNSGNEIWMNALLLSMRMVERLDQSASYEARSIHVKLRPCFLRKLAILRMISFSFFTSWSWLGSPDVAFVAS